MVTPVLFSPFINTQLMGAAPLYSGNNDVCRLIVPFLGSSQTTFGSFLNAITRNRSALYSLSFSINSLSSNLLG